MKNIVSFIFLLALLVSGCSQEEMLKNGTPSVLGKGRTFTTEFEQNDSRTYVENGLHSRWTEGDCISLFDASTLNCRYLFAGDTGDSGGTFFMLSKPEDMGTALSTNYAVYPYSEDVKMTEDGVISVTLPSEQHYAENSYGLGDNTMVAVTEDADDTFLSFKNVGGCLKLQLYGDDVTVKSIILMGNNGEKIAGKATITPTYGEVPIVCMEDNATETITLDCGEKGVKIGTTEETATSFWVVLPPTTFAKGFTVMVMDIKGDVFVQSTSNELVIERNVIKPMTPVEVKSEKTDISYLTFMAGAPQTLTMSKIVETLEYSVGNDEWKKLGTNIVEFGGELGALRLRGKNLSGTATGNKSGQFSTIKFGNDTKVSCIGDIRTLVDYENVKTVDTSNARFCMLFKDCTCLVLAPKLSATALASYCYNNMFRGCTNLTLAPILPAMTLTDFCYNNMFYGCTSLIQAPKLQSTSLAEACYGGMFWGCINLTQAPELPATTLAKNCYCCMFVECTSLTQAPELSATILADFCYCGMFGRCTNIVRVPDLQATTLAMACYSEMFSYCTSLKVTPELPAMILTDYCYQAMFYGCTSLTHSVELPARTLVYCCYQQMFYGCKELDSITMLATNISATNCLYDWVEGVSSIGTFTKASSMKSLSYGSRGIPSGWIVKDKE